MAPPRSIRSHWGVVSLLFLPFALGAKIPDLHFFASTEGAAAAREAMGARGATSISICLVDGDRFPWEEAFGYRALAPGPGGRPLAATTATRFGLGQTGRILAAIAVLQLVDEGRVGLGDPVGAHLPDFRMDAPEAAAITLEMLLSQTSGIPGTGLRNLFTTRPIPGYAAQVLESLNLQRPLFPPGTQTVPSGDGFTVLAALVEKVTGLAYPAYVQKAILDPLGMGDCAFVPDPGPREDPYARAFDGARQQPLEFANAHGACGFYASAPAMGRLMAMLLEGGVLKRERVLSSEAVAALGRARNPDEPDPFPAFAASGLGWDTVEHPAFSAVGLRAWSIGGQTPHYGSAMILVPGERMGVFVAGATGLGAEEASRIAERVLMRALVERGRIGGMPDPPPWPDCPGPEGAPAAQGGLDGIYASPAAAYRVRPGRFLGTLDLDRFDPENRTWRSLAPDLRPCADGWFASAEPAQARYLFHARREGRYLVQRLPSRFYLDDRILAERLAPAGKPDPLLEAWRETLWLLANESMESAAFIRAPGFRLASLPGRDDLLFVQGPGFLPVTCPREGAPAEPQVQVPGPAGQDAHRLVPVARDGRTWLVRGGRLFRPLSSVPALGKGDGKVGMGPLGLPEWRLIPPGSRGIRIAPQADWAVFDARLCPLGRAPGPTSGDLPRNACLLAVQGRPGTSVAVHVR